MVKQKRLFIISLLLLMLTGCGMSEELTDWAAEKANDALEVVGGGVQEAIDDLKNAEYQDGPFENNLESARAYLLAQLQEKYGIEFIVAGDEDLENYGLFAGATYTCDVAPINAPEQVTTALVSQTMYQDVRDGDAGNGKSMDSRRRAGAVPLRKRGVCKIGFTLYGRFRYRNVCGIPL